MFGNVWAVALMIYRAAGKDAARRFLTPPRSFVKSVCDKTGADFDQAIQERDESVEENLEFLESLVDANFEDPDTE